LDSPACSQPAKISREASLSGCRYPDLTHEDLLAALQFAYDLKDKFPLETAVRPQSFTQDCAGYSGSI
jgi:hypothetical protein